MKKLLLFKKMIIVVLLVGLSSAGWAQILYEGFNYATPGFIGGNTGAVGSASNNWTTHSITAGQTTTIDVLAGSLNYTGLAASAGNQVYIPGSNSTTSRDVNRAFTSTATVLYYSALINVVDATQLSALYQDYFISFGGTSGSSVSTLPGRLGIISVNSAANYRLGTLNNSSPSPATTTYTMYSQDLNFGTTYLIVIKLDISANPMVSTLWVNPTSLGGAEPTDGFVTNNDGTNTIATFASICIRNGSGTPKANIDEIRVGTTWADVTPFSGVGLSNKDQALRQTSIYPNPATTFFNVKAPEGKYLVSINNAIGSVVKTSEVNTTGKIEVSDLNPGLYFVTVENVKTNKKEVHKLFVK